MAWLPALVSPDSTIRPRMIRLRWSHFGIALSFLSASTNSGRPFSNPEALVLSLVNVLTNVVRYRRAGGLGIRGRLLVQADTDWGGRGSRNSPETFWKGVIALRRLPWATKRPNLHAV